MEMRKPITLLLLAFGMMCGVAVKGQLVITEIMYQSPAVGGPIDSLEFIEILNNGDTPVDLQGYTIAAVNGTFPTFILDPGERTNIARNGTGMAFYFPTLSGYQWGAGNLANTGEAVVLKDPGGVTVDSVFYSNVSPWPSQGAGDGYSITLCDVDADNSNGANWSACNTPTGMFTHGLQIHANPNACCGYTDVTPPVMNGYKFTGYNRVAVGFSEVLSNPSRWLNNFSCNAGVASATFGPTADSIILMLSIPLNDGEFDTVNISGVSDLFCNTSAPISLSIVNNYRVDQLTICEIMYDDPTANDDLEFFEIYNAEPTAVPVGGLWLGGDLTGVLPDVTVPSLGRVVIARNAVTANAAYLAPGIVGSWETGTLGDTGGQIELWSDGGAVDEVTYSVGSPWPGGANGTGYSIRMCNENDSQSDPLSWSLGTPGDFTVTYQGDSIFATPGRTNCRPIGVDSNLNEKTTVYPNPFNGQFELQTVADVTTAFLNDVYGRKVVEITLENGFATVDARELSNGIYFLNLYRDSDSKVLTRRVIKF